MMNTADLSRLQVRVASATNDQVVLDLSEYPAGTKALGIDAVAAEAHRLGAFLLTLQRINAWLAAVDEAEGSVSEALATAAIVTFCTCFEGTNGHRQRPLKAKTIYGPEDRQVLKRLQIVRNKLIAHDDGLFPMNASFAILGPDAEVIAASTLSAHLNWKESTTLEAMKPLVLAAERWTAAAADTEHGRLADLLRTMPLSERKAAYANAPPFVINVIAKDLPGS